MESKTRIRSVATITMFVTISLSRCWNAQSWMHLPGKRSLGLACTPRNRLGLSSGKLDPSSRWATKASMASSVTSSVGSLSKEDTTFLAEAVEHAKLGFGHTFPNPAVGCLLVRQDTGEVMGAGFHPRAGYPHAEIFALLEAAGHVESGLDAARVVVRNPEKISRNLQAIFDEYKATDTNGPEKLLGDIFEDVPVTAYVTLEPCCHYGKTPPCAASLALAKVDRVVVGFRDPNPKVDGGGVKVLQDAGIEVDVTKDKGCARIVNAFVKRIRPKDYDADNYAHVNGAMRRGLRKISGQRKADSSLQQVSWSGRVKATSEESVDELDLPAEWMEHLDSLLWKEELVNIRLNKAVQKKKLAKQLGNRIANDLQAHVAQVVGHTVLLYRPGVPPVMDLCDLAKDFTDEEE